MADDAPVETESAARQGGTGKRTLGILEWSLGLIVLCFAVLLLVAISATRAPKGDANRPAHSQTPPPAGTQRQGQR